MRDCLVCNTCDERAGEDWAGDMPSLSEIEIPKSKAPLSAKPQGDCRSAGTRRAGRRYGKEASSGCVRSRRRLNNAKYRQTARGKAVGQKRAANYRARLSSAEGIITAQDWIEILDRHKHRCYYCQKRTMKMTLDHITPLSLGGRNSPENVVPACRSCNCKKRNKIYLIC